MYTNCLHVILEVFLSCYYFGWGAKIAVYNIPEANFFFFLGAKNITETIRRERFIDNYCIVCCVMVFPNLTFKHLRLKLSSTQSVTKELQSLKKKKKTELDAEVCLKVCYQSHTMRTYNQSWHLYLLYVFQHGENIILHYLHFLNKILDF